jgi:hypothetical protein
LAEFDIKKTDLQQAIHFIKRLDNDRFAGLKSDIAKNMSESDAETAYPSNLARALKRAEEYTIVDKSGNQAIASVFTVKTSKNDKKTESPDKGSEKEKQSKKKQKFKKKEFKGKCCLCGEVGHPIFKCPELSAARECVEVKADLTAHRRRSFCPT